MGRRQARALNSIWRLRTWTGKRSERDVDLQPVGLPTSQVH